MRQCRFCGTFNDPSQVQCTTCDTSLDAQAHAPQVMGDSTNPQLRVGSGDDPDHTLNTRPLSPGAQMHQAQQAQAAAYAQAGAYGHPDQTAQFNIAAADGQTPTEYNQRSPHNSTDTYNVPPYLSTPPMVGGGATMVGGAPPTAASVPAADPAGLEPAPQPTAASTPALNAFESAADQSPPAQSDNPYQVDFGGFHASSAAGVSGKLRSLMVFLGLCCLGILIFFVYLFFADPSDDDKRMANNRKGPDITTPAGKTAHLLKLAKVHIAQQRWLNAKTTIDEALGIAPNQELQDSARQLRVRLNKEKDANDWFQQSLKYDKKGDFGSAYMSLQKVDASTKLYSKAKLLLKRIRTQRLPQAVQLASRQARSKRTYGKAYLTLLRIEQVAPKYKGLRRTKYKLKRKLKKYLYKKKRKCRKYCRRRYRGRRRRKSKSACYDRCSKRYTLPVLKPISIKAPKPTPIVRRLPPPPKVCCAKATSRLSSCVARCVKKRRRSCLRRARRKYRRSKRRRKRYIRRYCGVKRLTSYCSSRRRRRPCRSRARKLRRCKRSCK